MLGLGFGKLVVLAVIIAVVWFGFKYAQRVEAVKQAFLREMNARRGRGSADKPARAVEDLVKCERCGAFVAAKGGACGRADCPRRA